MYPFFILINEMAMHFVNEYNTVSTNGDGFRILKKKQGDKVKAGDPIIEVDIKKLSRKYDMSTMLIITNANDQTITFEEPQTVVRGQRVIK